VCHPRQAGHYNAQGYEPSKKNSWRIHLRLSSRISKNTSQEISDMDYTPTVQYKTNITLVNKMHESYFYKATCDVCVKLLRFLKPAF